MHNLQFYVSGRRPKCGSNHQRGQCSMALGNHYCGYFSSGTISYNKVYATRLTFGQLYMRLMSAWYANMLQWLDSRIGYYDSSPSKGHEVDIPYYRNPYAWLWGDFLQVGTRPKALSYLTTCILLRVGSAGPSYGIDILFDQHLYTPCLHQHRNTPW